MYCNQCGKEIANETEFCTYCGASVGKVCTECGSPIFEGSHFCVKCGKGINASCLKCGKELESGVRFCPVCGTDSMKKVRKIGTSSAVANSPILQNMNVDLILKISIFVLLGIPLILIMIAPGCRFNGFKLIANIFKMMDQVPEDIIYVIWVAVFLGLGTLCAVKTARNSHNFILFAVLSGLTLIFTILIGVVTDIELIGMLVTTIILLACASVLSFILQKRQ